MVLDVLAFKATDFPARNLVTNGDFSNGTTGFSGVNATLSAANNTLTVTGTGAAANVQAWFSNPQWINGQVYYARVRARVLNDQASSLRLVSYSNPSLEVIRNSPTKNEWYTLSARASYAGPTSGSGTRLQINTIYPSPEAAAGQVTEVQYMLLINLTQVFGAGNEPTREQMDELLAQFPNSWFNGVQNLFNAKYFLGMYFKKITELENAIAGLGGS